MPKNITIEEIIESLEELKVNHEKEKRTVERAEKKVKVLEEEIQEKEIKIQRLEKDLEELQNVPRVIDNPFSQPHQEDQGEITRLTGKVQELKKRLGKINHAELISYEQEYEYKNNPERRYFDRWSREYIGAGITEVREKPAFENFREGAEKLTGKAMDNAKDLIGQGMKTFDIAGTLTKGIGHAEEVKAEANRDARKAEAEAKARAEEAKAIEGLKKELEEKENQIKKLKEENKEKLQKKDDKIEKLEAKIEKLEVKVEASQDRLVAQIEEIAKSRSSSPVPFSNK